ncbi:MAG: hypothetical protein AAGH60_03325 [Pseudomonadota bacterium]
MLQDKRKDLDGEKRKKLLQRLVQQMSEADSNFYYLSTSQIAARIKAQIEAGEGLLKDEKVLLDRLTQRDIEVLLSLH